MSKQIKKYIMGSNEVKETLGTKLLPILDSLEQIRSVQIVDNIEVPGVVVCGAQSSGKSSLLESISGVPSRCLMVVMN